MPNNNIPVVPQNNLSSVHTVNVGDKIGNFTIKSINIFPFVYPDDKSQDFTVELNGEETVKGTVFWNDMFQQPCFIVDKKDTHKIPQFKEWNNPQAHFCFNINSADKFISNVCMNAKCKIKSSRFWRQ